MKESTDNLDIPSTRLYIEDRLATEDPDFDITRLFAEPDHRQALAALHVLRAEMRCLPIEVSDPGVALRKITWWLEEWQRLQDGNPRHPVSRELLEGLGDTPLPNIDGMISGTLTLAQGESMEDLSEVEQLAADIAGPLARIEGLIQGVEAPTVDWRRIVWVGVMEDLPRLAAVGRAPVPLNMMARFQISRDGLARDRERIALLWNGFAKAAPPANPAGQTHASIYAGVQTAKMRAMERGRTLGRWGRLWAGWRAARAVRARGYAQ